MKIKLALSILLAFLTVVFISQNTEVVRIDFLVWTIDISLVLLLFLALVVGLALGWLLNSYSRYVGNRKRSSDRGGSPSQSVVSPTKGKESSGS